MRHLLKQKMFLISSLGFAIMCILMGSLEGTLWYNILSNTWWEDTENTIGITTKMIVFQSTRVDAIVDQGEGTKLLKAAAPLDERISIFKFIDKKSIHSPFSIPGGALIGEKYISDPNKWLSDLYDTSAKAETKDYAIASQIPQPTGFKRVTLSTTSSDPTLNIGKINEQRKNLNFYALPDTDTSYDVYWDGDTTYLLLIDQYTTLFDKSNQNPAALSPQPLNKKNFFSKRGKS